MSAYEHWTMAAARRLEATLVDLVNGVMPSSLIHRSTVYGALSVAYYQFDKPLVPDATYDALCAFLLKNYENAIKAGASSVILDREMLKAGSGYHFANIDMDGYAYACQNIYHALILMRKGFTVPKWAPGNPVLPHILEQMGLAREADKRNKQLEERKKTPAVQPVAARERVRPVLPAQTPPRTRERPAPPPAPVARVRERTR